MKDLSRTQFLFSVALCLAISTLAVYFPVRSFEFVSLDDDVYVFNNQQVQSGLTLESVNWAFTSKATGNWHPVTWLSLMADTQVYGLNAGGYHMTNLLLHVMNVVLLFLVLNGMTAAPWRSAFVAVLFALHPLRIESVAWVSERKDVLSGLFWVLTMGTYARYARIRSQVSLLRPGGYEGQAGAGVPYSAQLAAKGRQDAGKQNAAWAWYCLTLVCFALGLMAKPVLVTLPFVLLLLDVWPLGRLTRIGVQNQAEPPAPARAVQADGLETEHQTLNTEHSRPTTHPNTHTPAHLLILEKTPFFALTAISCMITFIVQEGAQQSFDLLSFSQRIANAIVAYAAYLKLMVWPVGLACFYPHPVQWPLTTVLAAGLLLAGITLLAVLTRRRCPAIGVGWCWYLGTLVPMIGLVQVGGAAWSDRYSYIPLVGVWIAMAWGSVEWIGDRRHAKPLLTAVAVVAVAAFALVTWRHLPTWRNSLALFEHAVAVAEDNWLLRNHLGGALYKAGRPAEAVTHYAAALQLGPKDSGAYSNLGAALAEAGLITDAIRHYNEALRLNPKSSTTYNNLGAALYKAGRVEEAIHHYREALRIRPDYASAQNNLEIALAAVEKGPRTIDDYRQALKTHPNDAALHNNLAAALAETGEMADAMHHYGEALRIRPDYPEAHNNLGAVFAGQGKLTDAVRHFELALRLDPDFSAARRNLARAKAELQQIQGPAEP